MSDADFSVPPSMFMQNEEWKIIDQLPLTGLHLHLLVKHDHAAGLLSFA